MPLGATLVIVSPDNGFHHSIAPVRSRAGPRRCTHIQCRAAKPSSGGRIVAVGNVTDERSPVNLGHLITMGKSVIGPGGANRADMAALLAEHRPAPFTSVVSASMPLSDACWQEGTAGAWS